MNMTDYVSNDDVVEAERELVTDDVRLAATENLLRDFGKIWTLMSEVNM